MSAAAAVHSPPIPRPSTKRNTANCVTECERAQAALASEYTRIDTIRERVRPMRSATTPNSSPPIADATRVSEFRKPAVRVSMENSRMR